MRSLNSHKIAIVVSAIAVWASVGCNQQASDDGARQVAAVSDEGRDHEGEGPHNHGGWWCVEHGIPEEVCSLCSAKAAADFKAKGDWCKEHNRAESQCFICDPSRAEKYAKLYVAKFGHAPPESDHPE